MEITFSLKRGCVHCNSMDNGTVRVWELPFSIRIDETEYTSVRLTTDPDRNALVGVEIGAVHEPENWPMEKKSFVHGREVQWNDTFYTSEHDLTLTITID